MYFVSSQCITHVEGGQLYRKDCLLSNPRQFYREDSLSIRRTQHSDISLVRQHNSPGNREAKPCTLRNLPWSFVDRHMLAAVEAIENMREIIRVDALAVVDNLYKRVTILLIELKTNPAFGRRPTIFEGIIKQNM